MSSHQWNHFIPQSYLKGFSPYYFDREASKCQKMKVWFYNKTSNAIKLASVDKIARRPRYYTWRTGKQSYDSEIEEKLSAFEGRYIPIIAKIKQDIDRLNMARCIRGSPKPAKFQIRTEDIQYLASYMCLHMLRIPTFFDKLRDVSKEAQKGFDEQGLGDISGHGMPGFENTALLGFAVSGQEAAAKAIRILMNKNVTIFYGATRKYGFMSCDNPVSRKDNFEALRFPLFQRVFVQFSGQGNILRYVPVRELEVFAAINTDICKNAKEEVYSSDLEDLTSILRKLGLEYSLQTCADSAPQT